jgi:hypothetical protein
VRDNLRHASVSTTSIYLHSDEVKRARQMSDVFAARKSGPFDAALRTIRMLTTCITQCRQSGVVSSC